MGFVEGNPRLPAMRAAIHDLLEVAKNPLWLVKPLRVDLGRRSVWGRLTAMLKTVDELLYREIRERRANMAGQPNDVLSLLLQARYEDGTAMSDIALRDEMITLLVAGHETTATALAWIFQYVLHDPETQHELEHEIERHGSTDLYASLANMPLLDSVVKETLRLRPVVPHVARHAQEDISIGGRVYQAGTRFLPSAYLTHRRADLWPEATVFRPRRFIDVKPSPYEYFPFGGGTRRCIGMAFALYEIKVVALTLLQQDRKMRLVRNTFPRAVRRSLTFAPAGGTEVIGA